MKLAAFILFHNVQHIFIDDTTIELGNQYSKCCLVADGRGDLKDVPAAVSLIRSWTEDLCQRKTTHNFTLISLSLLFVVECDARR